jgi:glycosyltransferase involved in cell wall biosynthesis
VVSNSRGIRDYVVDGRTATVVPPGNPEPLAEAIVRLLNSPQQAAWLGQNARQFVVENCRNSVYARCLAGVLREAARKAGLRPTAPPLHT